jgi:transposase
VGVMSAKRYTEEFEIEVINQEANRAHPIAEVASRLIVTSRSLYQWLIRYGAPEAERQVSKDRNAELRRLEAEFAYSGQIHNLARYPKIMPVLHS